MKIIFEDLQYDDEIPMYNTVMEVTVDEHANGEVIDLCIEDKNKQHQSTGIVLSRCDAENLVRVINLLLKDEL